jgi:hypothetical protein
MGIKEALGGRRGAERCRKRHGFEGFQVGFVFQKIGFVGEKA